MRLAEFDFKILYKKGKDNSNADALSRLCYYYNNKDNKDKQNKNEFECGNDVCSIYECLNATIKINIFNDINLNKNEIRDHQCKDSLLNEIIEAFKYNLKPIEGFQINDGLLYVRKYEGNNLMCVPNTLVEHIYMPTITDRANIISLWENWLLIPIPSSRPFELISLDIAGPFKETKEG